MLLDPQFPVSPGYFLQFLVPVEFMFIVTVVLPCVGIFEKLTIQQAPATNAKLTPLVSLRLGSRCNGLRIELYICRL